jgi:RimK family alpha-L-glutamate ligase
VIKSVYGSNGNEVYCPNSVTSLLEILSKHNPQNLLVQPLIQQVQEFRVIILGDHVLGAVIKSPKNDDFRANWSQGGRIEPANVPDPIAEVAILSCQALQCDFAGVDILYDGYESSWVLEVNRYFQFRGFEEVSQINVASALLDWIQYNLEARKYEMQSSGS